MENVRILDCTLRDGGRIIDCKFKDNVIKSISANLTDAGIEIVEVGFLRDAKLVSYNGDSTFFTDIDQINNLIPENTKTLYTAFIDYLMFDFDTLIPYQNKGVCGIRVGFTKKQYMEDRDNLVKALKQVKDKGYRLFIQAVNTPGYSDKELLELVEIVNEIHPYSFGIVDTYGTLYLEDLTHIFDIIEHNLAKTVCIDIHSHNNLQSSFAFAQEIVRIAPHGRNIIFDSTLNGMGKCAGNLNTELIADYLNRKKNAKYDLDMILDIIDLYLTPLKEQLFWGYSIPAFMAGIYRSHPNNIIYLTEKYRLKNKDIKYIISSIDEQKRQRYDYDNISRIYNEYFSGVYDDKNNIQYLRNIFEGKNVVALAPGRSLLEYEQHIKDVIEKNNAVVISINCEMDTIKQDYLFFANAIHWSKMSDEVDRNKCIVTSNINEKTDGVVKVNYTSLIEAGMELPDNSMIMLINLMYKVGANNVMIAGFDGIRDNNDNYVNDSFVNSGHGMSISKSNKVISQIYNNVKQRYIQDMKIELITPSLYEDVN